MANLEVSPTRSSISRRSSSSSYNSRGRRETIHLTPYNWSRPNSNSPDNKTHNHPYEKAQWSGEDPRSSSMHSLRPVESQKGRRKLLLIYIHGFLGNETSFQSFPAHVHNVLTITLAETHTVHTKIYPRYKSRGDITFARDAFSGWLSSHEDPNTDIVLLGHSLGGILAAEVALLPSSPNPTVFKHRLLGLLTFDTPFLGMHPGVISAGLGSIFRPKEKISVPVDDDCSSPGPQSPGQQSFSNLSLSQTVDSSSIFGPPSSDDPNYNPMFENDVRLAPERTGWDKAWYFIQKHADPRNMDPSQLNAAGDSVFAKFEYAINGLTKASKEYVLSHWEFGGCLADYPGLKKRYARIRSLEDVDELTHPTDPYGFNLHRVRFLNYYSASTGRLSSQGEKTRGRQSSDAQLGDRTPSRSITPSQKDGARSAPRSPRISLEEHTNGAVIEKPPPDAAEPEEDDALKPPSEGSLRSASPRPMDDDSDHAVADGLVPKAHNTPEAPSEEALNGTTESIASPKRTNTLPPIPDMPQEPPAFKPELYTAKDTLKQAQKEHSRTVKAFERAKKDRDKTIRDREKMIKKREKQAEKEAAKQKKLRLKQSSIVEKEQLKRQATLNPETYDAQIARDAEETHQAEAQVRKKKRDKKFCSLPPKDENGQRDPCWIRVYMEGVDEVEAHTSLFFLGPVYEKLVGDTSARIEEWVKEDGTRRVLLEELAKQER